MAREHKPLELRPVDDIQPTAEPVIRLASPDLGPAPRTNNPVRLGPQAEPPGASQRLELPAKEEVELRTHQPGIEAIIEAEPAPQDPLEQAWGEQSAPHHPIPWGWFALIGAAICGAVAWSLSRVDDAEVQADKLRTQTESALIKEQQEEREAALLVDRLHAAIRGFFAADEPDDLEKWIRQPERVGPLLRRYYRDNPWLPGQVDTVKMLRPLTLDDRSNFWLASISLDHQRDFQLIMEVMPDGVPLIDWETLVCHQPMPWDDFVAKRPTDKALDFRVYVEPDTFYNHEFADSKRWMCFRLTAFKSEEALFGYAPSGSPLAQALLRQIQANRGGRTAMLLRLSVPPNVQSRRGVVIEKVLSNRWLYLDPPANGS